MTTNTTTIQEKRQGYFGQFGGAYVPPAIADKLQNLAEEFYRIKKDKEFEKEYIELLKTYVGRPSPLF